MFLSFLSFSLSACRSTAILFATPIQKVYRLCAGAVACTVLRSRTESSMLRRSKNAGLWGEVLGL